MDKRRRTSPQRLREQSQAYFDRCAAEGLHPSLPGLALALDLEGRRELELLARDGGQGAGILRRAITRVEEANIQSAYKKDSAASAKFILQNGFGYSEKTREQPPEEITVNILEEEP